ncbi:MAG TPA: DUF4118 domain-containing protein [Verrucomicrobiae bacterium]|jgi:two-component system sensor histidine kinase KdpD|nr:DUF4118 domain-containing protein [Verrucomicrobiae bacterium]
MQRQDSPIKYHFIWHGYAQSLLMVVLVTLGGELLKRTIEPINLIMFYLLAVIVAGIRWGHGPAVLTSVLSVLAFDFFLIPPYLTFGVEDFQYVFTFAGFLIVGLITSELMTKTKEQARKARQLELLRATKKLQTALLNSVSHDLRTPLASIIGSISMLLQDEPSLAEETIKGLLRDAYGESLRLNRLVGNLLDMTRLEAGALNLSFKSCDLRDVLGVALQELADKLEQRRIKTQIPHDLPEISADFSLIMKVLVNLIDNAAKYSSEDTPIRIAAKTQGDRIKIEIMDEGIGIAPKDLKPIFDKFYRASHPSTVEGLGLGLSIAKGIVEAHHGEIWAESGAGKGTTFVVLLPYSKETA